MRKLIIILLSVVASGLSAYAQVQDYREAVRLYEKDIFGRSRVMFDKIEEGTERKADPAGYSVLCDVRANVPGYVGRMESFFLEYPYSVLVPQVRFYHALNLFARQDYEAASRQFGLIKESSLYRSQRTEYVFKSAYCNLENGDVKSAKEGFLQVQKREVSDYTAPSGYAIGYLEYNDRHFDEAEQWFEKAATDVRFKEMAEYFIIECRFRRKDYDYVISEGQQMYDRISQDRRPHLARLISEAHLVRDNAEDARKYYDLSLAGGNPSGTRSDWFYGGSVMYAVKDYEGAIDNFTRMGERRDSIGQIASYHLGFSYIQTKDKVSAMESFKEASQLNFSDAIAEDALFNYAKLAFDLNSDISIFNEYLYRYSDVRKGDRIYSYIGMAELLNRNYAGAVDAYDKIDELDDDMRLNYMKANYLRANQLIRSGSYRKAVPCLKAAAYYSKKSEGFNQLSRFWLAESYYRTDRYDEARKIFMELHNASALYGRAESYLIPYNIAYCYFKSGNYSLAKKWFGEYLGEKTVKYRKEALLRKADCDFVVKNYKGAAAAYDIVLRDYFSKDDIYPYYQAALSYGLVSEYDRKIELLLNVLDASPESEFYPEALFELGRSYAVKEEDENAARCFEKVAATVKDSTYVAKAYIELGTIARNQSMFNEALGYYKTVVEEMPLSEYADDALIAIESIYQTRNDPQEYLAYIDRIGKGGMKTEDEKELMIFNAAEQVFLSENYNKALVALQSYMDTYPQGKHTYKAAFYVAESCRVLGMNEQACDAYRLVIDGGEGSFVELSMLNFADLSYGLERWEDAYGGYSSLKETAQLGNNAYVAQLGMMRASFRGSDWEKAVAAADDILSNEKAGQDDRVEAEYVKAKSYLASSRREEAMTLLEKLSGNVSGRYGAEAAYLLIQDSYDRGEFEKVETKVYDFADAGSPQTYWLAKSFIVLGDSFMEREDVEQARATFESVRDGYTPTMEEDDVLDNVKMRLSRIGQISVQE